MTISFIVTTYNVAPYISHSLASLAKVVRPGDEIIIVDDGSTDETPALMTDFIRTGSFGREVETKPIFLGTNTPGGVGVGANIGLDAARCDSIVFMDGDDWINPKGFNPARAQWQQCPHDILITNYLTYDTDTETSAPPADNHLWTGLNREAPLEDMRLQALAFIAVPWRKFYRRAFLEAQGLRFPEGNHFFEDNPFHWAVCRAAEHIDFANRITCYHRVNRPGQTMGSTGIELLAFFTHFDSIWSQIPATKPRFRQQAGHWLLENMAWHMARLAPEARAAYATIGARTLARIDDTTWAELQRSNELRAPAWHVAQRLRQGDVYGQIDSWDRADIHQQLSALQRAMAGLEHQTKGIQNRLIGQNAASSFEAIKRKI